MAAIGRCMMIVNPASGTVSKHRIVPHVCKRLDKLGINYTVSPTRYPGHARELAREAAADSYDVVIAVGGDGTVNEVASGLVGSATALAIIPTGSGNGLARHLGIPVDIDSSIRVIAKNNVISADYGTANDKPFFCTFGVGFDAAVSERCARQKRRGILMYLKNTINEYMSFSPEEYVIEANGQVITDRAFLVVVCNASQYGNNAYIAPSATIDDGLLDVTIIHAGNTLSTALVGFDMLIGMIEHNMLIHTFRTSSLTIERTREGAAHLDGEPLVLSDRLDLKCHHRKLNVFAPESLPPFRPILTPASAMLADFRLAMNKLFQK